MTTQVTLLRHGETSANRNGIVLGTSDVPLTKIGRLQAKMAAQRIAEIEIDSLFSSPYYRAKETSKYVQETTNLNPIFLDGLKEMNSGEMEDLTPIEWKNFIQIIWQNGEKTLRILVHQAEKLWGKSMQELGKHFNTFRELTSTNM